MRAGVANATMARKLLAFRTEAPMGLIRPLLQSDTCCVEVSGWDEREVFFVEKTDLDWNDLAGKQGSATQARQRLYHLHPPPALRIHTAFRGHRLRRGIYRHSR
jgi:hypothetical protein